MTDSPNPTSESHFSLFQSTCRLYQSFLNLKSWELRFRHEDLDGDLGSCSVDVEGRVACLRLGLDWKSEPPPTDIEIILTARHEMLELLTSRLNHMATCRFVQPEEIGESRHELIRTLESTLPTPTEHTK